MGTTQYSPQVQQIQTVNLRNNALCCNLITAAKYSFLKYSHAPVFKIQVMISKNKSMENPGIDPGTSRMLSGRSTIWANSPIDAFVFF